MLYETGHGRGYLSRKRRGLTRHLAVDLIAPSSWGYVADPVVWASAMDAYLEDNLEPAQTIVGGRGIGSGGDYLEFCRILDCEFACSAQSEITRLSDTVEVEAVASDLGQGAAELGDLVLAEIGEAERRFNVQRPAQTLVTFLLRGSYIPTSLLQSGYFVEKSSNGKICLPGEAVDDLEGLRHQIRRGVCYQILYRLTEGEACRWFLEAAVAAVDPPADPEASETLRSDPRRRLPPTELEHVFQSEKGDDPESCRLAIEQAHVVGRLLLRQGVDKLLECAKAHLTAFQGYPHATDYALVRCYGSNADSLFDAAWSWSG